jgi:hypothetical protein
MTFSRASSGFVCELSNQDTRVDLA